MPAAENEGSAEKRQLWRVLYEDGDTEEVDATEMQQLLTGEAAKAPASGAGSTNGSGNDGEAQGLGMCARAMHKWEANDADEVAFEAGTLLVNVVTSYRGDSSWWVGTAPNGQRGSFPHNYVKPLDAAETAAEEAKAAANSEPSKKRSRKEEDATAKAKAEKEAAEAAAAAKAKAEKEAAEKKRRAEMRKKKKKLTASVYDDDEDDY